MSYRGGAGQRGFFRGHGSRQGYGRGGRPDSGYLSRNNNSSSYDNSRSEYNYGQPQPLMRTPPPPPQNLYSGQRQAQELHQTSVVGQPQAGNAYQITFSINAPQSENLSYNPYPVHIKPSKAQMQPTGAMIHPDPPPPYTPYPEVAPPSRPFHQRDTAAHLTDESIGRGPEKGYPERGKGIRMRGNFSQSMNNLRTLNHFEKTRREQHGSAASNSSNAGQRRGQAVNGWRERFPTGRSNRSQSISRDVKDELGDSSVRHNKNFSETTSSSDGSQDRAFHSRGKGGDRQYSNQRGRGQRSGQCDGVHFNRGGYNNSRGQRKSANKNWLSQDNQSYRRDSVNECKAVQELCVQVHFGTCFETGSVMKKHIQSALKDLGEANLELSCEEILLEHKLGTSFCKFKISDRNISSGQKYVEKMVNILKKTLKISVSANFEVAGNVKTKESSEPESGGPKMPNTKRDGPKEAFSSHSETDSAIRGQENVSKKRKKRSRSKQISSGNESKDTHLPIPTTLYFEIEKQFSSHTGFKTFLRNATSSLEFDFEVDDDSVHLTAQLSKCQIQTKSKANARRLQQHFSQFTKQTQLCINCNIEDKRMHEKDVHKKLDELKSNMLRKKSELLQKHEGRISQNKEEFMKKSSALPGKEADIDFKATHDKLLDAIKQRDVFMVCFDKLFRKLELLGSSASQIDEVNHVEDLFKMECSHFSRALPIYAHRDSIMQKVESSQVSIIVGETGCGKSTQIAQYLLEAGFASNGIIVCTQPSQLTALSLADKVSKEKAVKVGTLVGYKTGVSATKTSSSTKILYTIDHSLLNEFHEDPYMEKYSCIIIDEAHEHSVYTDLLLGLIKSCLPKRPDLKIIIISAPGHQDVFLKYFKICQEVSVSSSNFTVDAVFTEDSSKDFEDWEDKAISQALKIHKEEGEGDIMIFVSLPVETLRCSQEFESRFMGERKDFVCLPFHSKLPLQELKKVFERHSKGKRKVIFATKFAETSLSIDSVKYIVETGITSQTKYDFEHKVNLTTTCPVTQFSALQRRKCAGLSQGGKCYHLYSRKCFDELSETEFPEIIRVHLEKAVLKLLELKVDLKRFEFVQAPSEMALDLTIDTLTRYGAIDHSRQITNSGKLISALPFDPKLGYLIAEAQKIGLLYDAIVLAAIVSFGSDLSYRSVSETEADVNARNKKFLGFEKMDSFAWLHVYKLWSEMEKEKRAQWCRSKSINYKLISSVWQCIEEVYDIMAKCFYIKFCRSFSEEDDAMAKLKELYKKCKHLIVLGPLGPPLPPPWEFMPLYFSNNTSYLLYKFTCYRENKCHLKELWPFEKSDLSHLAKK